MKGRRICLDHIGGREAAALMVDGRLEDLLIDDDAPRIGAIYRGVCDRALKGQGGMMLRIPGGTAWMRGARGLSVGDTLLCQVTGVAEPGKAVPVTDRVLFKSRYAIVTPHAPGYNISRQIRDEARRDALLAIANEAMEGPFGLILRSHAAEAEDAEIAEDIGAMLDLATAIMGESDGGPEALTEGDGPHAAAWREWRAEDVVTEPGCFEAQGVMDALEALRGPREPLEVGDMFVEPTRALVAVDVNTGGDTSPAAALKANLAAARALPRALRLRGLGGQITVDFAPMPKGQRKQVEQSLRASFKTDQIETSLVGWTPMGCFELQRKRERPLVVPLLREVL